MYFFFIDSRNPGNYPLKRDKSLYRMPSPQAPRPTQPLTAHSRHEARHTHAACERGHRVTLPPITTPKPITIQNGCGNFKPLPILID